MTPVNRVIITREKQVGRVWAEQLQGQGFQVLELPLLHFTPIAPDADLAGQTFDWILFTSPQGVRAFFSAELQIGSARLGTLGDGTAGALQGTGHADSLGIKAKDGRELASAFIAIVGEGARVLLPGPRTRGSEVQDILNAAGCEVTVAPLYETLPVPANDLPDNPFLPDDLIFFCSPSTVRAFCRKWEQRPPVIAIGETTAAITRQEGFPTTVAETPHLEAMIQAAGRGLHLSLDPES